MPRFNEYDLDFDINVEISVDTFLSECDSHEINDIINWLKRNGELSNNDVWEANSLPHEMFLESVDKIVQNYYQLTNEEQELIEKIAKRF
jgi:hypothetical protein